MSDHKNIPDLLVKIRAIALKQFLILIGTVLFLTGSCNDDTAEQEVVNPRTASFNTFGVKWGEDQTFSPAGFDVEGPGTPGGTVTFSFRSSGIILETHSQSGVESQSFSAIVPFAREEIGNALNSWSEQCQIDFVEQPDSIDSDISFFIAPIEQGGLGYPPQSVGVEGNDISGQVIFQPNQNHSQHGFYVFALHEIGHALGLGHASRSTVMGVNLSNPTMSDLQPGDIRGLQEIYGLK